MEKHHTRFKSFRTPPVEVSTNSDRTKMPRPAVASVLLAFALTLSSTMSGAGCSKETTERSQTIYGSGFDLTSCEQLTEQDVYELCLRIYHRDPEEFECILITNKFHQHMGPNNVYGAKMALHASRLLNARAHTMHVLSEAGLSPPIGCLNDGIMAAVCSSFGRGLISNVGTVPPKLAATFIHEGEWVRLDVDPEKYAITRDFIAESLMTHGGLTDAYFQDVRSMALLVWENFLIDELFVETRDVNDLPYCASSDHNLRRFENRLYDVVLTAMDAEVISDFVDRDPCVNLVSVDFSPDTGYSVAVEWITSAETFDFNF